MAPTKKTDITMEETIDETVVETVVDAPVSALPASVPVNKQAPLEANARPGRRNGPGGGRERGGPGQGGRSARRREGGRSEEKPEFDQRIIDIRRVARVMAGGRRFSFSVSIVIGNRKGQVGVGLGKGGDTSLAIAKALRQAKKNLIVVPLTKGNSIPHESQAKYCAALVELRPARGRGLVAGSAVRAVLDLAGINDVSAKIFSRSKNKLNNARAAHLALSRLSR